MMKKQGMLVLDREEGELVAIGNEIKIKVLRIRGSKAKFGITAPTTVTISKNSKNEPKSDFIAVSGGIYGET